MVSILRGYMTQIKDENGSKNSLKDRIFSKLYKNFFRKAIYKDGNKESE